ncbi:MAG: nucleotidyltransferase domain-containing protein [Bryobacterales bacterium]|nr:nucleotidyltransferase domain-containing protein [Acidobacteriota bacterium]MCB9384222.1 nucleotidyltransferase domain-containing protein [Bryobacterales bacterium]
MRKAWLAAGEVSALVERAVGGVLSSEMTLVVFGSLARGEWTVGSDLDWTLLIDGQVDPKHLEVTQHLAAKLGSLRYAGKQIQRPGIEGTFGNMAFSHPIVHHIGGESDTNRNVTQRILLLSESKPIGVSDAHDRVVKAVLSRYVGDQPGLMTGASREGVPRFLLNDVVRYWRTVTVDFVYKRRARGGKGAGLRNIKLRLSRKLLFTAGLLHCFLGSRFWLQGDPDSHTAVETMLDVVRQNTPLDRLAVTIEAFNIPDETAREILGSYDEFLGLIDDEETRKRFDELPLDELQSDSAFLKAKEIGDRFDQGLKRMFFDGPDELKAFTREYGIF